MAIGAAQLLAAIVVLPTGRLAIFGLLVLAALPWIAVALLRYWKKLDYALFSHALAAVWSVALIFSAVVVIVSGTVAGPPPSTAANQWPHVSLQFLKPAGPQPHCETFNGTGVIPKGYSLVLFDRPSDAYGNYMGTPQFGDDGPVARNDSGWTATNREIGQGAGDAGTYFAIVALLVPQSTEDYLDDVTRLGYAGNQPNDAQPVSVMNLGVQEAKLVIQRNNVNAQCPH